MNQNATRTLWISLGSALFAMMLIYSYSQEKKAEYDKKYGAMEKVVVAKKDILEMSTIDDTMFDIQERPIEYIQPDAAREPENIVGLVAAAPIKEGEQILLTKLLTPGPSTGLSLQVAPNKRAVTIPVDEVRGVSKLVRPGDRVDILTSVDVGRGQNQRKEVKTLMQDVVVLATGVNITNNIPRKLEVDSSGKPSYRNLIGDTAFSTITIETTPKEAQNLIYIMSSSPGSIYLTLRNPNDRAILPLPTASVESVMGRAATPTFNSELARVPAAAPKQTVKPRTLPRKKSGPFTEIK